MRSSTTSRFAAFALIVVLLALAPLAVPTAVAQTPPPMSSNATVFFSGLDNPRGLKFGPDGFLYVAEGGQGGKTATTAQDCEQVPAPVGPYSGGMTARISKISPDGKQRTTVAEGLPSSQTSPNLGGLVSGVADIAFVDNTLYALITGAGCSHGLKGTANAILKVNADGTTTQVADLSAFYHANPVKQPEEEDFEPDGTPYSMIAADGKLYVVEPNHGSLEEVSLDGKITRIIDISAAEGHAVPTSVAFHEGKFYIGNLSTFPVHVGVSRIFEVTPDGKLSVYVPRLAAVLGDAFDAEGRLYALETTSVDGPLPAPGTGRVVMVKPGWGPESEVATGLTFPTAMTLGPDGQMYVSNFGFGFPPGKGEIVRIKMP